MLVRAGVLLMMAMVAGCSEKNEIAETVESHADNRAQAMEAAADSMTNALQQNAVEQQAATVREAGEERADAIRRSQLDARKLTQEQKAKLIAGEKGTAERPAR